MFATLFGFSGRLDRRSYLAYAIPLVALKSGVDALAVRTVTGQVWTPLDYLTSLPGSAWASSCPIAATRGRWPPEISDQRSRLGELVPGQVGGCAPAVALDGRMKSRR